MIQSHLDLYETKEEERFLLLPLTIEGKTKWLVKARYKFKEYENWAGEERIYLKWLS